MESIAHLHPEKKSQKQSRFGRLLMGAIVGCAMVGFAPAAMAQLVLQQGDSGTAVSELQDRLRALGCYDGSTTGFFGPQTQDAVIRCQEQRGITADGIVGPETYRALGLGNSSPGSGSAQFGEPLQLGDRGPGVQELQTQLQSRGYYYGAIDGVFGQDTQSAVIQLQQDLGLSPTGVVDAQVYAALQGSVPPTLPPNQGGLQLGDESPRVLELQQQLNRLGYPVGTTGYFGPQTQQAVFQFQRAQGLPANGVADAQTLAAIERAANGGTPSNPQNGRRYSVIIPFTDSASFNQIQRVIPDAVPRQSRLGNFVRVGSYSTTEEAERVANALRSQGLTNARVVFE